MEKKLKGKQNLQLVGAAAAGAVMANMPHLEFVIAIIAIILVAVSFKDTKLKKWVVRFIKFIAIAIIIVAAMAWHNTFCNDKSEVADEVAQQDEVVTEEKVEDQPEIPVVETEEVEEEVNPRICN